MAAPDTCRLSFSKSTTVKVPVPRDPPGWFASYPMARDPPGIEQVVFQHFLLTSLNGVYKQFLLMERPTREREDNLEG